jgi:hypothetical protein
MVEEAARGRRKGQLGPSSRPERAVIPPEAPAGVVMPFSASVWPLTMGVCRAFRFVSPRWFGRLMSGAFPAEQKFAQRVGVPGFAEAWTVANPHTLLDVFRLANLARLLHGTQMLPGDVFECGVASGGTSLLLAMLLERWGSDKRLWLFDSYQGLSEPDRRFDRGYERGQFAHSLESVRELMERHGVAHRCVFEKGWFADTLPRLSAAQQFSFGHVDCDLYHPARECIAQLYPRLPAGGALAFDDYYDGSLGVFRAVNSSFAPLGEVVQLAPSCQAFVVKGSRPAASRLQNSGAQTDAAVQVSFEALGQQAYYADFLNEAVRATSSVRAALLIRLKPKLKVFRSEGFTRSIDAFVQLMRSPADVPPEALSLLGPSAVAAPDD